MLISDLARMCFDRISYFISAQNLNQQQRPHTRLEIINGILHQKLIFVESPADIIVKPTDCVIFNDGSKSSGCTREEFKPYVSSVLPLII